MGGIMSYLIADGDCSPSEIDLSAVPSQGALKQRRENRRLLIGFATSALIGIATFASADEPTVSTPEPAPASASESTSRPSTPKGDGSGYEGMPPRRLFGRLKTSRKTVSRALISDQTYYGGKLGIQN